MFVACLAAPIWPKNTQVTQVMWSQEKMLPLEKVFNHRGLWVPILVAAILVKVKFLKKFVICCSPNKQNIARPNSRKGRDLSSYKRGPGVSFLVKIGSSQIFTIFASKPSESNSKPSESNPVHCFRTPSSLNVPAFFQIKGCQNGVQALLFSPRNRFSVGNHLQFLFGMLEVKYLVQFTLQPPTWEMKWPGYFLSTKKLEAPHLFSSPKNKPPRFRK